MPCLRNTNIALILAAAALAPIASAAPGEPIASPFIEADALALLIEGEWVFLANGTVCAIITPGETATQESVSKPVEMPVATPWSWIVSAAVGAGALATLLAYRIWRWIRRSQLPDAVFVARTRDHVFYWGHVRRDPNSPPQPNLVIPIEDERPAHEDL